MNRQDRDRHDYGRYDGYNNDEHYHSARNLTDEFEQEYQRDRGYSNRDIDRNRMPHSYHEGNDVEDTYQRLRRDEDSFRDRTDYMRNDRDSDRNYYGNFGRADNDRDNYRGNMGMYRGERGKNRYQEQNERPLRSDNAGQYNPYNSSNYSRTRESRDNDSKFGDGYRGSRYGGNSEYLSNNQQGGSSRNSDRDRDYRGGTSYSGPFGSNNETRFSRDRDRNRDDRWFNSDERTRYY